MTNNRFSTIAEFEDQFAKALEKRLLGNDLSALEHAGDPTLVTAGNQLSYLLARRQSETMKRLKDVLERQENVLSRMRGETTRAGKIALRLNVLSVIFVIAQLSCQEQLPVCPFVPPDSGSRSNCRY